MAEQDIQDLIVIRRRASSEPDQVKGGVWKIAFADFMTAMMCFFLVMWLINAANEDTRQAVASYFNPMRLAELNRKGIANPHVTGINTPQRGEPAEKESEVGGNDPPGETTAEHSRDALFRDPYAVLSEIAGEAAPTEVNNASAPPEPAAQAYRDPFDPEIDQRVPDTPAAPDAPSRGGQETAQVSASGRGEPHPAPGEVDSVSTPDAVESSHAGDVLPMSSPSGTPPQSDVGLVSTPPQPSQVSPPGERLPSIEKLIADAAKGETPGRSPKVVVERAGGGVLISLTDEADFGMFAIGSAEPQPQMVRIMERIAGVLKTRKGAVTIRGHTDARPFRSVNYDNWRLSTDRAQMAYYMLVRGGLDEHRVAAIEGYADRKLKLPENPEAAENRRIEIFLREDGS